MERDPLNFFSPFERLPANHENQLTRALLVLIALSPTAHAVWLRLIAPTRELHRLPRATFATQRRALRRASPEAEPAELISVFLAPEQPLSGGGVVTESDRGQVLDAIIDYDGELLVVVENKVAEADDYQARHLNITGASVHLPDGTEATVVLWRDVLDAFIALRERRLVGGAEDAVLDHFLTYAEDHFPTLGPFRTLGLCQGNTFRQRRRLRQVLGEATGLEASMSPHGPYVQLTTGQTIGADAYLRVGDESIELSLYPADTLTQARNFYTHSQAVAGLRHLRSQPGWHAGPSFHFGHFQRGYCWTRSQIELDEYIDLWTKRIATEGVVQRDNWSTYWRWLVEERIACAEDWPEFERHFVHTNRQSASPRPGVWLSRRWAVSEAEQLDATDGLTRGVREALDDALAAFGEPPLASTALTSASTESTA